jgi:hypothetical protein
MTTTTITNNVFIQDWNRHGFEYDVTQTRRVVEREESNPEFCLQINPVDHTALIFNLHEKKL